MAVSAGAAGLFSSIGFLAGHHNQNRAGVIRIRPISGTEYSPSFLRFSERMTFSSVREAVRKVKDRSVDYLLVAEPA